MTEWDELIEGWAVWLGAVDRPQTTPGFGDTSSSGWWPRPASRLRR
jgi:hypothetical protein